MSFGFFYGHGQTIREMKLPLCNQKFWGNEGEKRKKHIDKSENTGYILLLLRLA
jgi:hypothetical protein